MRTCLKVTAHLATPLVADPPFLDAILENEMAQRMGVAQRMRRDEACPVYGGIHIPMLRQTVGGMTVPCCSSPIILPLTEVAEYLGKRLAVEHASALAPKERKVVATGNAVFKSYRLPMRVRRALQVVWFAVAHRRPVLQLLRSVRSLGHKRGDGFGLVAKWEAEAWEHDWSWFAPSERGPVLMRPLPWCDDLPAGLLGYRRDFGACQSPYWHPDRYREIVVPC